MNLYILRHGNAEERGVALSSHDRDRALTPEGRKRTLRLARALGALGISFDLILSSPYVRARETAAIVAQTLKAERRLVLTPHLTPGGNHRKLVDQLHGGTEKLTSVLLVGHEPDLSGLISVLLTGEQSPLVTMKKGGLCRLTVDALRYGRCASLEWLLPPKIQSALR
jgi:phosphohistidine phosphatase